MWLDDKKEGPGKFVYKAKRQMYKGEWSKGLPKCGTLVDLPVLAGGEPKKYPIPEIKLADADGVLETQREEIREARISRMMVCCLWFFFGFFSFFDGERLHAVGVSCRLRISRTRRVVGWDR
jgi:hypothetical protein